MGSIDLLNGVTARLASTARLDEIVQTVVQDIVTLGFGAVWLAVFDEQTGRLSTLKEVIDGVETTDKLRDLVAVDVRYPIGVAFREDRMVNITDPGSVYIFEGDDEPIPPNKLAMPRKLYNRLRGRPFASGPLLGSRGQPVGAIGLSSYQGGEAIPDAMLFSDGPLRTFMKHLGIAIERALHRSQLVAKMSSDAQLKAIGELAGAVAHDLNNLCGIAQLAVSVGMRSPSHAFDVLPRIERATRAIGALVASLQRIARPSSSDTATADVQQIIDDILILFMPHLREKSIEVGVEMPALPRVRCDAVVLHQVLFNLILNAHDALGTAAHAERQIAIRASHAEGVVRLVVADNGPGIPPEVLGHLFERYTTTKGGTHLGLGLVAARTLLKGFAAEIAGRNAGSSGAEFEVTLVADGGGAPDAAPPARPVPAVADHPRRARILAVDDDPDVVYFIREFLEPLGYEVATATSSTQAIAAATSEGFDLVLCDIGLPNQNGLDVCRLLRKAGFRGKLVLMTGWDTQALNTDQRGAGCDMLLKKPFVGSELLRVIDTVLE